MPQPRNDAPCPCGSEDRFDACCGEVRMPPEARYTSADLEQALRLLSIESQKPEHAAWLDAAREEFWGEWAELRSALDEDDEDDADELEAHSLVLAAWVFLDRERTEGRSLAGDLLARRGEKLLPGVRNALRTLEASYLKPYTVVRIEPGAGFVLEPFHGGARVWVSEATAGEIDEIGNVYFARVLRDARGGRVLYPDAFSFSYDWRDALAEFQSGARLAFETTGGALDERSLGKALVPEYHHLWCTWLHGEGDDAEGGEHDDGEFAELDPNELPCSSYRVHDAERLRAAIGSAEDFDPLAPDEEDFPVDAGEDAARWEWYSLELSDDGPSAWVWLVGERLEALALDAEVDVALRARLGELASGAIAHVSTRTGLEGSPDDESSARN
ncbi:MAG: SEC-C domain-containing protein [Planctomycetes bacterium]|nr:SEC-C domain-containing protein [Planctomycetota bacterium]